jgi:succinate-acetate transporter protein
LSINDRTTAAPDASVAATSPVADPAPLGLAAFALTTFLLSAANAGWMTHATGNAWLGYAFAYGGLCQLLAGMWEFRNRNVFGATAFSTYGGFWIGLGLWVKFVATAAPPAGMSASAYASATLKDQGWILLAFAIFNTYMLLWSMAVTKAVFAVFLTLEATEIILFAGAFAGNTNLIKAGGYVGVLTALVAWYTSSAGVFNGMRGRAVVPVGKPFIS